MGAGDGGGGSEIELFYLNVALSEIFSHFLFLKLSFIFFSENSFDQLKRNRLILYPFSKKIPEKLKQIKGLKKMRF